LLHNLSLIPLAPFLIFQGRRVKAKTPRLAEASGPRSGTVGEGPLLNLLILGDSAAAGVGVDSQNDALSGQLAELLASRMTVNWTLQAHTGLKVVDFLPPAERLPKLQAEVIVVSLGVNDVTGRTSVRRWTRQVNELLDVLQRRYRPKQVLFTAVPPMDLFPALPEPLRWYLGERARLLNLQLEQTLADRPGTRLVTMAFEQGHTTMASDGFHPGKAGYSAWARTLANMIEVG